MLRLLKFLGAFVGFVAALITVWDFAVGFDLPENMNSIEALDLPGPAWMVAGPVFILAALLLIAIEAHAKRERFDRVANTPHGWSLTFTSGDEIGFPRGPIDTYGIRCRGVLVENVRITNLSRTLTRIVDVKIRFKNREYAGDPITLPARPFTRSGVSGLGIRLAPQESFIGNLEFAIPPEYDDMFSLDAVMTTDLSKIEFEVSDGISGKAKSVLIGEVFDAYPARVRIRRKKHARLSMSEYRTPGL